MDSHGDIGESGNYTAVGEHHDLYSMWTSTILCAKPQGTNDGARSGTVRPSGHHPMVTAMAHG